MNEPNMKPNIQSEAGEPNPTNQNQALVVPEAFIDKAEVARRLGKTPRTVESWVKKGQLPCVKINRSVLFKWADVEARLRDKFTLNTDSN